MESSGATVRPMIGRDGRGFGLALSAGRLAQVVPGGVRLLDAGTGRLQKEVPGQTIIALGALADGSLLAIERSETMTVAIHMSVASEVVLYPMRHLVFDGNRELLADPSSARQFFLLDEDRRTAGLYELVLVAGFLRLRKFIELPANSHNDVVALSDGALVHSDVSELQSIGPVPAAGELPRRSIGWSRPHANILASGPHGDDLWAATPAGDISLVRVAREGAARIERTFKVPGPIYQMESAKGAVAVLQLEQPESGARPVKWTLLVVDELGKQRLSANLPPEPPQVPLATPPRNRCLRVSAAHVAVGGPEEVTIWEIGSGRMVHHGSASPR